MLLLLGCVQPSQEFVLHDGQNYSFSSSLDAQSTKITEGEDAIIDWSSIDRDMLGNELHPSEIDKVSIIRFPRLSKEEVLLGINNETLKQSDLSGFVDFVPQDTLQENISAFSLQGTTVQPETDLLASQGTFLVLANRMEEVVSLLFFEPSSESENHQVFFTSDSVELDYDVSLLTSEAIVLEEARDYYIDWSGITKTGTGNPVALQQIDRLLLGGFSQTLDELETDFLRLEQLAEELYVADVAGQTALPLSRIDGFVDFDPELQWIVALQCSRCLNPAPFFVGNFDK